MTAFEYRLADRRDELDYLSAQGVTCLHLMPLLKMPHPDNDGGYAVEDFGRVDPALASGDEIGQLNGYGYHDDPDLAEDSRNLYRLDHRGGSSVLPSCPGTLSVCGVPHGAGAALR